MAVRCPKTDANDRRRYSNQAVYSWQQKYTISKNLGTVRSKDQKGRHIANRGRKGQGPFHMRASDTYFWLRITLVIICRHQIDFMCKLEGSTEKTQIYGTLTLKH
jgi:hypothetical protein